jgi:hypothetical protein
MARGRAFHEPFPWNGTRESPAFDGNPGEEGTGRRRTGVRRGRRGEADEAPTEEPAARDVVASVGRAEVPRWVAVEAWDGPPVEGPGPATAPPDGVAAAVAVDVRALVIGRMTRGSPGTDGAVIAGGVGTGSDGRGPATGPVAAPVPAMMVDGFAVDPTAVATPSTRPAGEGTTTGGTTGGVGRGRVAAPAGRAKAAERAMPSKVAPMVAMKRRTTRLAQLISNIRRSTAGYCNYSKW